MVKLYEGGAFLVNGTELVPEQETAQVFSLTGKEADKEERRAVGIDPCYLGG